jgi:uracil-DNA glycosylase family 4
MQPIPIRNEGVLHDSNHRKLPESLKLLQNEVVDCRRCPRLVEYRERIGLQKRRAYLGCDYWARPVPGFGDPAARVLVFGLAPGAHGSNRTGRPFTGDASGKFMYPVLHRLGFASQPNATACDDGMTLRDLWITAAVRCAPPDNKPLPSELANCAEYTDREFAALKNLKVVVTLGKIAFDAYLDAARRRQVIARKTGYLFAHAAEYRMPDGIILLASYHPSNQNTATKRLTVAMFESVFTRARQCACE